MTTDSTEGLYADDGNMPSLTFEQVADALRKTAGIPSKAARRLKRSRQVINGWLSRHPELRAVAMDAKETVVDSAEWNLVRDLKSGEPWATKFVLETLGKDRGYTRRSDVQLSGQLGVNITGADYAMA